jgi:hypothetical protein
VTRRGLTAPILAAAWLSSAAARAEPPPWLGRASLTADVRGEIGAGDVAGIDLGAAGAGIEWWVAPTLRLRTTGLLLGATGADDTGRAASGGAGGELAARLVPFPAWPVRPYARLSAGFLLFLRRPFLPGGDFYDFILSMGVGLEVPIGARLSLMAEVHATHLSNGQGLGDFNPAFGGHGALAGVSYALSATPPVAPPEPAATPNPRDGWTPGAIGEADAGWAAQVVVGSRVRVAERLAAHLLAMLDARAASYGGVRYEEVGLALVGHWRYASAGAQATYEHLPGIDAVAEQAQVEANLTAEVSLFATAIVQQETVFSDFAIAGLGARLFPFETLRLDGGVSWSRPFVSHATTDSSPYVAIEWQLPLGRRAWQLSIFAERQLSTTELAGLRFAWNMGGTLRDVARRSGWMRIR